VTDADLKLAIYSGEGVPEGWARQHWPGSPCPHIGRYWPPNLAVRAHLRRWATVEVTADGWVELCLQDGPLQHNNIFCGASVVEAFYRTTSLVQRWHSGEISSDDARAECAAIGTAVRKCSW
jgi:hypothetical protein